MAVTKLEFYDLIHLLEERPEWRAEMRRVLFPQDVLDLPRIVQELATAQQRTEEALARLTEQVDRVATNQERIWEAMEKGFAEAAADRERIWEAMEKGFAEAATDRKRIWEAMEKGFAEAAAYRKRVWQEVSRLKGIVCEERYRSRADAFFGRVLTRGHNATQQVADLLYTAYREGRVSEREWDDALNADLFWGGKVRETGAEVVLVLEASWLVDKGDVERASRRARVLQQTGLKAVPVAAGEEWIDDARVLARREQVLTAQDGSLDIAKWLEVLASQANDQ